MSEVKSVDPNQVLWFKERSALTDLPEAVIIAIAAKARLIRVQENRRLVLEETRPKSLYILYQGRLEQYRTSRVGPAQASSLLPGAVLHLLELVVNQPAQYTVITLTQSSLWEVTREDFQGIVAEHAALTQHVSQQLAANLAAVSSQLAFEQERQNILRPYRVPRAKRGIVGNSRYAKRLRQDIRDASRNRNPIIILGEPGLEKDNIAALIHFSSPFRRSPIIKVACKNLQASGAELWGRWGGKPGLLAALEEGTLILNNIQDLPPKLWPQLKHLLETQRFLPIQRSGSANQPRVPQESKARLILVTESEAEVAELTALGGHLIKVPPLRVRKSDIEAQVTYYLSLIAQTRGTPRRSITPAALRRLQAYRWPQNLRELASLLERAIAQVPGKEALSEEVFWPAEVPSHRFRLNLLEVYPWLRNFLRSDWWPTRLNYGFTLLFFAFVVAILFLGPQDRLHNVGLTLFWAWWWPIILVGFPFVGRLWCAVCPFMIYGELLQILSLKIWPRQLQRWPRELADRWGGWFLWGLFALIFLWEELWDLPNTAYLSSWLLLLITGGAIVCSLIFERRFWCRYLCPIGGMNGLYAKLSMTELRAKQGTCAAECSTYQCYKGGPANGEGQQTQGCPLYSHPAQLEDNRDCVLCMTCLKACPHRSVEVNLRPPAIELWTSHQPRSSEVALLLLLLGGVFLHRLPELEQVLGLSFPQDHLGVHAGVALAVLGLATAIPGALHGLYHLLHPDPQPFLKLAYGYLPLTLGATLAHYLYLGLTEAGQILPVASATFGGPMALPMWSAHPAVIAFLQGTTLVFALLASLVVLKKIARQTWGSLWPHALGLLGLTGVFWQIIVGS
ncbi:cyclic nucleotide-binding domain-containing protein [Lyngbya confervoides]|uniref:Cyclic nucleotide-binding domain-containing protein n=1 Tax=Lyngbya confervoides BDU141951 TaxID=1574623 RepID=A0ABD4T6C9_9CYAN|nr:cyclic nucleotide-binding domain-containing protein [Lyngbya confervoides]MCM1984287.1 cyclic nucleotide-binding domain-containing protein [Lyngbya confervoides BDU141951]